MCGWIGARGVTTLSAWFREREQPPPHGPFIARSLHPLSSIFLLMRRTQESRHQHLITALSKYHNINAAQSAHCLFILTRLSLAFLLMTDKDNDKRANRQQPIHNPFSALVVASFSFSWFTFRRHFIEGPRKTHLKNSFFCLQFLGVVMNFAFSASRSIFHRIYWSVPVKAANWHRQKCFCGTVEGWSSGRWSHFWY